jgi:hypothetical protein
MNMEVKVLPIYYDPFDFEHDHCSNDDYSVRLKGSASQSQNYLRRSSPDGERIAAVLWFRSWISCIAHLKGNYSLREKDHA